MYSRGERDDELEWGGAGDDVVIANEIDSVLLDRLTFNLQPIEVSVHDGTVTLRGIVRDYQLRNMAAGLAASVPGVREVVNEIDVMNEPA